MNYECDIIAICSAVLLGKNYHVIDPLILIKILIDQFSMNDLVFQIALKLYCVPF